MTLLDFHQSVLHNSFEPRKALLEAFSPVRHEKAPFLMHFESICNNITHASGNVINDRKIGRPGFCWGGAAILPSSCNDQDKRREVKVVKLL